MIKDDSVEFQSGKVSGVFNVGTRIENLAETYELEAKSFESMKAGISLVGSCLESYKLRMTKELLDAHVPVKEIEIGKTYVNRCLDLIKAVFNEAEAKRLQAQGGAEAIRKVVESTKKVFDAEQDKLKQFDRYANSEKDPKERPVGYPPGKQKRKSNAQNT